MQKGKPSKKIHPSQHQRKPGLEARMVESPIFDSSFLEPRKKLEGKTALITGGDSGIGRAVAVAFARQGASIGICHLQNERKDAIDTKKYVEELGAKCILFSGNLSNEKHCIVLMKKMIKEFHRLDILVNNAGTHYVAENISEISKKQLDKTFQTNFYSMFYLSKEAIKYMKPGSCIINTASVTAYRGSAHLIDYSATKGAIISFTRSLASSLIDKKIRVNAVRAGPVWTPLIVSSMKPKEIAKFGSDSPMGRAAHPAEIAPCYVFLANEESSFITGQVLHPNGGEIING